VTPEIPLELASGFPAPSLEAWRSAVDRVLAGKDADLSVEELEQRFAKVLVSATYDGIDLQPLYCQADADGVASLEGTPGAWPFVRGTSALGGLLAGWDVRQSLWLDEAGASTQALEQLENGATSLFVRARALGGPAAGPVDVELLDAALDGVFLELISVALDAPLGVAAGRALLELLDRRGVAADNQRAVLGLDPLGEATRAGEAPELEEAVGLARSVAATRPLVRTFAVDATRYHEAGASDVEELAFATATALSYVRAMVDAGLDATQALGQIEFRLAATCDQFATIAKLRAGRLVWARVAEVLGVPESGAQRVHALTSRAMLAALDPSVNLLRNTTAAFAAGAGGAEAVTVEPHDLFSAAMPSALGRRLARNTQLLLLEESQLHRVLDPAGGAHYVERRTQAMAEAAWSILQEVEASGGMADALGSGQVAGRCEGTWQTRRARLTTRSETMVGVNDFPNPVDVLPAAAIELPATQSLPRRRWAEDFEALRRRAAAVPSAPPVLLVRLGPTGATTARATFASAFFETGGLATVELSAESGLDEAALGVAVAETGARLACLCSTDPLYAEVGEAAAQVLSAAGLVRTYAATRPGGVGQQLTGAGIDELVWAGCDVLEALDRALGAIGA
jgi:methylmalonyl-CoA mutase